MNPFLRRVPATLGLSTPIVVACLVLFVSPGTARTFTDEVRNAAAWLDEITTPKGAFLWPLTGDICGLPRR